ncbi:MAG: asparagine synthase-related protein [Lentisphaeria bacterium]
MSGIALGYGKPEETDVQAMMDKLPHRGGYLSGSAKHGKVVLMQNYLHADTGQAGKDARVPVKDSNGKCICYDGQMGNAPELGKKLGLEQGPFFEERIVLELYRKHGIGMFEELGDTIFGLAISDGEDLLVARDLLGIKTLFYGKKNDTTYVATELKALAAITDDINEFPNGCYMDKSGEIKAFGELPKAPEVTNTKEIDEICADIRDIIQRSLDNRLDFHRPTASLLSGGLDSSVIAALAAPMYKKVHGEKLKTFAVGIGGESSDIKGARLMADHIDSDHYEYIVPLEDVIKILPDVIYYLENFDPSLVRSAAANFLISEHAKQHGVEVLLSGEGGDEVFCGYMYLKDYDADELRKRQVECLQYLHNNASLRLDRMNESHSIRVVAPLVSGELLNYSLGVPPEYKQKPEGDKKVEKWIFRKAFENHLPNEITWRLKQEFSQGSGSAGLLPSYFEDKFSAQELQDAQAEFPIIRSKEELYYFKLFTQYFGTGKAVETVGQWPCL